MNYPTSEDEAVEFLKKTFPATWSHIRCGQYLWLSAIVQAAIDHGRSYALTNKQEPHDNTTK